LNEVCIDNVLYSIKHALNCSLVDKLPEKNKFQHLIRPSVADNSIVYMVRCINYSSENINYNISGKKVEA